MRKRDPETFILMGASNVQGSTISGTKILEIHTRGKGNHGGGDRGTVARRRGNDMPNCFVSQSVSVWQSTLRICDIVYMYI